MVAISFKIPNIAQVVLQIIQNNRKKSQNDVLNHFPLNQELKETKVKFYLYKFLSLAFTL